MDNNIIGIIVLVLIAGFIGKILKNIIAGILSFIVLLFIFVEFILPLL